IASGSVSLTLSHNQGTCTPPSDQMTVSITGALTANITPPQDICGSGTVGISVTASSGVPPYSYIWSTGQTGSGISVSPTSTTSYAVTVMDSSGGNCGSVVLQTTVTVNEAAASGGQIGY